MAERDFYETLGVSRSATDAEIKQAYRRLAMKYHPDRNEGDADAEARFKDAKEAYEVLSDGQRRAAYDQFGHAGLGAGGRGGGGSTGDAFGDIFGDVFGDIFGGGRRAGRSQVFRGADLRYMLRMSLERAVRGDEVTIEVPKHDTCDVCGGDGSAVGSSPATCSTCDGLGQVRMQQGFFSVQQSCPSCRGRGQTITDPCSNCQGSGRMRTTKTLSVKVPAGVDDGDRIRLSGEGEVGRNGGPPGDLYVEIEVEPHKIFQREGANLACEIPIGIATAALGGEVEAPTLDGEVSLKIPAGTQSGRKFRMRGKGVRPVRGGAVGDLYCTVHVETPVQLTREQREILESLDKSLEKGGKRHTPKAGSWLDGVKSFFDGLTG